MPSASSERGIMVGVHYKVGRKIGEGSFGVIFQGTDMISGQEVAIKFEPKRADAPQLKDEYRTYRILAGCAGIPQVYYFGQDNNHNTLVIDLLGPSLEDLFDMCGRKFSVKTVAMAAKQMVSRVQGIHEKNLIYRDIKPDNFLIGRPGTKTASMIWMVDFGMAKQYRDPRTKQHIPYRERKSLSGTARYMSINTHLGREQSRRDDLEALGHVFMYFLRGGLPWQGLKAATNKQKYEKIGDKKQLTSIKELTMGFPDEFYVYLDYARKLGFEETPDYDFLRELFNKILKNLGESDDGIYDWNLINDGRGWEATPPTHVSSYDRHRSGGHRDRDRDRRAAAAAAAAAAATAAQGANTTTQYSTPYGRATTPSQLAAATQQAQPGTPRNPNASTVGLVPASGTGGGLASQSPNLSQTYDDPGNTKYSTPLQGIAEDDARQQGYYATSPTTQVPPQSNAVRSNRRLSQSLPNSRLANNTAASQTQTAYERQHDPNTYGSSPQAYYQQYGRGVSQPLEDQFAESSKASGCGFLSFITCRMCG